jgi:integrase
MTEPPEVQRQEVRPLSTEETRKLLAQAYGDRLHALFITALYTGLRQGELLGLRWGDVDLDARTLSVRNALQRVDGRLQLISPKTSKSRRRLSLSPLVVSALRAHGDLQEQERLAAADAWVDGGFVFTTLRGKPLDGMNVTHRLQRLAAAAELPAMRFHDLRHTYASLMIAAGVDLVVISKNLGHASLAMTADTYSHLLPETQDDAAARFEALLAGRMNQLSGQGLERPSIKPSVAQGGVAS